MCHQQGMQQHEEHFLEEKFKALEPLVIDLFDFAVRLGAKENLVLTKADEEKVLDIRARILLNVDKGLEDGSIEEATDTDKEKFKDSIMPLVQAVEDLAASLEVSSGLTNGFLQANEDITVDDRSWFHVACALGKVDAVKLMILRFACDASDANRDYYERTPLFLAAAAGHHDVVGLLLEKGADPTLKDDRNMTPLEVAEKGDHKLVSMLLNAVLKPILQGKYAKCMRLELLARDLIDLVGALGAVPRVLKKDQQQLLNEVKTLDSVAGKKFADEAFDIEPVTKALEPLLQTVTLYAALEVGTSPENNADDLLARSLTIGQGNFTRNGWSWFLVACALGNTSSVEAMIRGCGCNHNSITTTTDENGWTPLSVAATEGHIQIAALLIRYGAVLGEDTPSPCVDKKKYPVMASLLHAFETRTSHESEVGGAGQRFLLGGTRIETKYENTECVVVRHIGKGTFGHVYKVFNTKKVCFEAVKVIRFQGYNENDRKWVRLSNEERVSRFRLATEEVEKMLALGKDKLHPNLVALHGVYLLRNLCPEQGDAYEDNLYIFMDYVQNEMTLKAFVRNKTNAPLETIVKLMLDVARGLLFISKMGHSYGDLKPENILVDAATMVAKISDFGSGYTPEFAAPETADGKEDPTQHQWSWATTTLAALEGGVCSWTSDKEAVQFLKKQKPKNNLHRIVLDLCGRCMQSSPEARCPMADVVLTLENELSVESLAGHTEVRDQLETWAIHMEMGRMLMEEVVQDQRDLKKAKLHLESARDIAGQFRGMKSAIVATSLNYLASLLHLQRKFEEAKSLHESSLKIREEELGPDHADVAQSLNHIGELLSAQSKFDEAKRYYDRALKIRQRIHGASHPDVAASLSNVAGNSQIRGNYDEARRLYDAAIEIAEATLGPRHPGLTTSLNNLAGLMASQGNVLKAFHLQKRCAEILENSVGPYHPQFAATLDSIAGMLIHIGQYSDADEYLQRSLTIRERIFGHDHLETTFPKSFISSSLQRQGHYTESLSIALEVLSIRERALGTDHPVVFAALNQVASLLEFQGKLDEAKEYYERALEMSTQQDGLTNASNTAVLYSNLAGLREKQGYYDEAISFMKLAIELQEKVLGPNHQGLIARLNKLGELLDAQGHTEEARTHKLRAHNIMLEHIMQNNSIVGDTCLVH